MILILGKITIIISFYYQHQLKKIKAAIKLLQLYICV